LVRPIELIFKFGSKHSIAYYDPCLCSTVEGVVYSTPNNISLVVTEQVEDEKAIGCGIFYNQHYRVKAILNVIFKINPTIETIGGGSKSIEPLRSAPRECLKL